MEREKKTVRVNEFITVSELAQILKTPAVQIVGFAFKNLGLMVTINQRLDFDQIELIAGEFGFQAVKEEEYAATLTGQPPTYGGTARVASAVVTTGARRHGKTSLLDYIARRTCCRDRGLSRLGVSTSTMPGWNEIFPRYARQWPSRRCATWRPGHGIVVSVAADDQCAAKSSDLHAKNAGVPMIVASNKLTSRARTMKGKQICSSRRARGSVAPCSRASRPRRNQ